jgi:NADH-quinone oxidoreductase subunit E
MRFSEKFEQRFTEWLTHYPIKRSVLVPSLLYIQDELGYVTDEAIQEMAARLDLTELEVRNVISYYSMLSTKPRGKFKVQVCTNICCMLRGAEEVLTALHKDLGIRPKETTADGQFSLEEVECIGACCWGPAMQVNYTYHEKLTPENVSGIIEEYRAKGTK